MAPVPGRSGEGGRAEADKTPATLERLQRGARRRRRRPGHRQRRGRERRGCSGSSNRRATRSFDYAPEYANAELTLARALVRSGAYNSAERYLLRVLGRGPKSPVLRRPPTGRMVDVGAGDARAGGDPGGARSLRAGLAGARRSRCRSDSEKRARLPGRQGRLRGGRRGARRGAVLATSTASRASTRRRSTSGASSQARQQHFASARRILCEIVEQADQNRFTFFIDGRYYGIKDLAYLALGRIAHEQGKYDDAYYFYFRVPEDSERLPDALFEASWSMFQKGEYEAAGAFLEEFDRSFGKTPLAPDVMLLHAMIDLKSCRFDEVRATLDKLVKTYGPMRTKVAALLKDPGQADRVLPPPAQQAVDRRRRAIRVIELLKIDAAFYQVLRRHRRARPRGGADPDRGRGLGRADRARAGRRQARRTPTRGGAAGAGRRGAAAAGQPAIRRWRTAWRDSADAGAARGAAVNVAGGPFAKERRATLALGAEARKLRARLVAATSAIAEQGAGRSRQAAARAAAPGAPHAHRRGHRQEEEAGDRDREPARGPLPGRAVRARCSSRG